MPTLKRTREELHALRKDKYPQGTPICITKGCAVIDPHHKYIPEGTILKGFLVYNHGSEVPRFSWTKDGPWVFRNSVLSWDFVHIKVGRFIPE